MKDFKINFILVFLDFGESDRIRVRFIGLVIFSFLLKKRLYFIRKNIIRIWEGWGYERRVRWVGYCCFNVVVEKWKLDL